MDALMDFLWAFLFLLGYELLSLPMRAALAVSPADGSIRRVLSRLAGPVAFCLPIWLLGHFLPIALTPGFFWIVYICIFTCILFRVFRVFRGSSLLQLLGYESGPSFFSRVGLDLVSIALFFIYIALRRYSPDMTTVPINGSGAEKFTNAMLFWSNWHAGAMPPEDYWLAGQPLVYYYWGHFFWAWVGRMIFAPGPLVINLALARLTLLVFESAWLLGRSVKLPSGWATAAALIAAWGGNIAAIPSAWSLIHANWPNIPWGGYSYWDARSVMPGAVNEFPAFTAILGDFHSHHMALPWLIGWLALIVAARTWLKPFAPISIAWIAMGAGAVFSNMWNLPLMAWAIFLGLASFSGGNWRAFIRALAVILIFGIVFVIGMALMRGGQSLPLPQNANGGLLARIPLKPVPGEIRSTFAQLMNFWGLPIVVLGLAALGRAIVVRRWFLTLFLLSAFAFAAAVGLAMRENSLLANAHSQPFMVFSGIFVWLAVALWSLILALSAQDSGLRSQNSELKIPQSALLFGVLAVLIGLELVFIDDFFVGKYERYNTYFKFSYPLWPALIVVSAPAARTLWNSPLSPVRRVGRPCLVAIALVSAVYPIFAFPARNIQARAMDETPMPPTLNAVDFLKYQRYPYNAEAPLIDWIRGNVPAGKRVAEAPALNPYIYGGRVACLAGRPIPLGWSHHEVQWRGPGAQAMIGSQTESIDRLYRAQTPAEIVKAAREIKTRWVMWGIEEERRYGAASNAALRQAGRVAIERAPFAVIDLGESVLEDR